MAENSNIEWTDHTFNPWIGCTKVGPGCDHCYAEARMDTRLHVVHWGPGMPRKRTTPANWREPERWNRQAAAEGRRFRVFCASLADVFDNEVPVEWRADLLMLVRATPHLDWLLLTKRIGNVTRMLQEVAELLKAQDRLDGWDWLNDWSSGSPPHNVWLGASIVSQEEADRDIPKLVAAPARVRFLSMEPLLGPVEFSNVTRRSDAVQQLGRRTLAGIDWVIVGGESGHNARPLHPEWARSLRDQCAAAGVPFLFKQWGEWLPMMGQVEGVPVRGEKFTHPDGTIMGWAGKKASGRRLDGAVHDGCPERAHA